MKGFLTGLIRSFLALVLSRLLFTEGLCGIFAPMLKRPWFVVDVVPRLYFLKDWQRCLLVPSVHRVPGTKTLRACVCRSRGGSDIRRCSFASTAVIVHCIFSVKVSCRRVSTSVAISLPKARAQVFILLS